MSNFAVILSGCGSLDGSDIWEAVLLSYHLDRKGNGVIFFAPDAKQKAVVDHLTQTATEQTRNILQESARIARGGIKEIEDLSGRQVDGLILPGGHGVVKNLAHSLGEPENGYLKPAKEIQRIIREIYRRKKPIGACGLAGLLVASALRDILETPLTLTIGKNPELIKQIEEMGAVGGGDGLRTQAGHHAGKSLETQACGDGLEHRKSCQRSFGAYPIKNKLGGDMREISAKDITKAVIPICQDTGFSVFFVEMGDQICIKDGNLFDAINEGVRQGYRDGYLRKSILADPIERKNTGDNTPAVIHTDVVSGDKLRIIIAPKGGGSENMSEVKMMKPADGVEGVKEFVIDKVRRSGSNPCPPIVVGVGIGGTFEKCAEMAKRALLRTIGSKHTNPFYAQLEEELLEKVNKLGIGAQGFGGTQTALAVFVETYPCHIASFPAAVNINCHAARHKEVAL
jgi:fumarate hydratase subunit alpha